MTAPTQQVLLMARGTVTDPYFSSVVLLLGFEGSNGSTGAPGMTDESPAAHGTGTVVNDAVISTAWSAFGASSLFLDKNGPSGHGSVVTFPTSSDWDLGSGSFTIEFFYQAPNLAGAPQIQYVFRGPANNYILWFAGQTLNFRCTDGVLPVTIADTNTPDNSSTYYACVDFDGSKYRLYTNTSGSGGAPSSTASMKASNTSPLTISSSATTIQFGSTGAVLFDSTFGGYVDEFRLTKGVARYASDSGFTVPTVAFPRS